MDNTYTLDDLLLSLPKRVRFFFAQLSIDRDEHNARVERRKAKQALANVRHFKASGQEEKAAIEQTEADHATENCNWFEKRAMVKRADLELERRR